MTPCTAPTQVSTLSEYSTTQDSWTGGQVQNRMRPGEWTDLFLTAQGIDWHSVPGVLILAGGFEKLPLEAGLDQISGFIPEDIDSDGDIDLFVLQAVKANICWLENTGIMNDWREHAVIEQIFDPRGHVVSDFDNDGNVDIALISREDGLILVLQQAGGEWEAFNVDRYFYRGSALTCVDLNSDGYDDLVGASSLSGVSWWRNPWPDGGDWEEHHIATPDRGIGSILAGDFNINGREDLLCASSASGRIDVSLAMYRIPELYEFDTMPEESWSIDSVQGLAQGIEEIRFLGLQSGTQLVYAFTGFAITDAIPSRPLWDDRNIVNGLFLLKSADDEWVLEPVYRELHINPEIGTEMSTGDVDGDGDVDICTSGWCFENTSDGSAWIAHQYTGSTPSPSGFQHEGTMTGLACADLDGNGTDELVFLVHGKLWFVDHSDGPFVGELISQVLNPGGAPIWDSITWSAVAPEGTSVSLFVRSGQNIYGSTDWHGPITEPGSIRDYTEPGSRYFQYKVVLESDCPDVTPMLRSVTVNWE